MHYISPNLGGGGTASPSAFTSVFAYIGSPPQLRRQSRLSWRQGPFYLLEDIVTSSVVSSIYHLGPTYVGCLQAPLSGIQIIMSTKLDLVKCNCEQMIRKIACCKMQEEFCLHCSYCLCFTFFVFFPPIFKIKLLIVVNLAEGNELCGLLISEEKVMLAVHAHAMCQLTVAKIRKVYNKVDSKSIAKQVSVISRHKKKTILIEKRN